MAAQRRPGGHGGEDGAVEEVVLVADGGDAAPGGGDRTGDREGLVHDEVGAEPVGERGHAVDEPRVDGAEQQRDAAGAAGAGELGAGDERVAQHHPPRDPGEGEAGGDVGGRQLPGPPGREGVGGGADEDLVPGPPQRLGERDERQDVAQQRRGHEQHTHGTDPSRSR
ncbi:hypothetical protein PQF33_05100 [Dactylosporangium aurantiacum]|nr:hypothetical protein [Dactylosporangium aurantiacum]MDG6101474.1 hypothetical protein [Dactylosporangium aurantiacum]